MNEERRRSRRAQLRAVYATFQNAKGNNVDGVVHDISTGGAFVECETPIAVGRRLVLDVMIRGVKTPVTAAVRVVWTRAVRDGSERPAGMAVVFLDLDGEAHALLGRLTARRDPTYIGIAEPANAPNTGEAPAIGPAIQVVGPPAQRGEPPGVGAVAAAARATATQERRGGTLPGVGEEERRGGTPPGFGAAAAQDRRWGTLPGVGDAPAAAATQERRGGTLPGIGAAQKRAPTDLVPGAAPAPPAALLSLPRPIVWLLLLIVVMLALAFFFRRQLFGTNAAAPSATPTPEPSSAPSGSVDKPPNKLVPRIPGH